MKWRGKQGQVKMMSGKRKLGLEYHHKQTDLLTALLLKMIGHII